MELYEIHPKCYVAIDCVILGYQNEEIKLLIYPRSFEPYKGNWSLLDGFVQEKFTLTQLRKLYEAIFSMNLTLETSGRKYCRLGCLGN